MIANNNGIVTVEYIRRRINYDPATGVVSWRDIPENRSFRGKVVSAKDTKGYGRICFFGGRYLRLHRVAWAHFYGEWPNGDLDHINGVTDDNRLVNLRIATKSQNCRNIRKHSKSSNPFKGITFNKSVNKWQSQIGIGKGKYKYLGVFVNPEDAAKAYDSAAVLIYGEFAKTNLMLGLLK